MLSGVGLGLVGALGTGYEKKKHMGAPVSDTDSFIEEVSEEVRRDRLFALMRRYGWIAIAAILLIVGGAAYWEYRKAAETAEAQAFGDAILTGLEEPDAVKRAAQLGDINGDNPRGLAVLALLKAQAEFDAGNVDASKAALQALSDNGAAPLVYRQVASFKLLGLSGEDMDADARRAGYEALIGGNPQLRLLAEEQIALIDVEIGNKDAALAALNAIMADAEATAAMQRRAAQLIYALGGTVEQEGDNG